MNHKIKNKNTGKKIKREGILAASLLACLIGFLFRIPLTLLIGDQGVGYFAVGMEVFLLVSMITSYGLTKAVAILIRYRMKRELYKSVSKVMQNALILGVGGSVILGGLFLVLAEPFAKHVMREPLSYLAITAVVPGMVFASVMGVLRGYFQGMGSIMPSIHSKYIEKILLAASGLLAAFLLYKYGLKIAAFLRSDSYAFAYGAMGGTLGMSVAAAAGLLHLLLIYFVYKSSAKGKLLKEGGKSTEKSGQIFITLITTAVPYAACALLFNLNQLVSQAVFNYGMDLHGKSNIKLRDFGMYYGKYGAVAGASAILCTLAVSRWIPAVAQAHEKQLRVEEREHLKLGIHQLAVTAIPAAVLLAVLAEPLMGLLFGGEQKRAAQMLQMGSALVVLFPLTYMLAAILQRIRKFQSVLLAGVIAFPLFVLVLLIATLNTKLGIAAVIVCNLVFYLIAGGLCFFLLCRQTGYKQEWIRPFGITIVASGASGVAGLLLNKLLFAAAGKVITLIVCLIVCIAVYMVLLLLLRGVRREELEEMPGGGILITIGKKMHIMK